MSREPWRNSTGELSIPRTADEFFEAITDRAGWPRTVAPALISKPAAVPPAPRAETAADRERREFLEAITDRSRSRSQPAPAFVGKVAPPAPAPVTETAHEGELREWVEAITVREFSWDPAKHPRGGFPENTGMFSPAGGSGAAGASSDRAGSSSGGLGHHGHRQSPWIPPNCDVSIACAGRAASTIPRKRQIMQINSLKLAFRDPDKELDPKLFLTPQALILTAKDNYDVGKTQAGDRYPQNHDWNEVAKLHGGEVPDNHRTTAGTFDKQLQDLGRGGKQFDTLVLAGHGGPVSPSIAWFTQHASPDGTKKSRI